ncbi:MAG: PGF-pre-PGF domain-containing protein, partial [Methanocorpusculum sp.]|nr:PGF-pre-PGF domain-containing protein [Methanocorpusculum sp.]
LSSNAYIDGCTFDNNTVYGTHASNVNYGINSYSTGYNLKYTNNIFRNSAAYQTNGTAGSVSGLSMMAVSTLNVEGNTVENSNKFFHRATVDAEFTEQQVRSVGSYSTTYGLTNIISGTYYGALSTYAGDKSIVVYGGTFSTDPKDYLADGYVTEKSGDLWVVKKYVAPSKPSSSSSSKPKEEPSVEEPVTPTEPVAGEVTVETEVTNGGEVSFETPAAEGSEPVADAPVEISAVVLPEGTTGEVAFVPVSEQPAPAGKETQTKKVFEINVPTYEKGKAAVVKFTMTVAELAADGKTAAEVALWHFDEETGEWTKLVTSYTIVDGVVYFEAITYDFSPFAIIYEDAVEQPEQPVEEPETPASPAPVLGVLAALGAAVVLRRK